MDIGHSCRRWLHVLALSVVVAVALALLAPLAWTSLRGLQLRYTPFLSGLTVWVVAVIVFYVAIDTLRVRTGQWRSMWKYPPLWSATVFGILFTALASPDWPSATLVAVSASPLGMAIFLWCLLRRGPPTQSTSPAHQVPQDRTSWHDIENWIDAGERPLTPGEQDLFDHHGVAKRIALHIGAHGRPLALLGGFGTGKTSILNLARNEIDERTRKVVHVDFDAWAVPQPEDIPRLALEQIVRTLDNHIDTLGLRHMPFTYQRLVAAEPTGRLARILGPAPAADSLEALGRLTPLLDVLDAQLLLIVQDIERLGPHFDTRHLERLLWALRQKVDRASFILAFDPGRSSLDYSKLCDTIELVPHMAESTVRPLLTAAYHHWATQFSDIDPHLSRPEGGTLEIRTLSPGEMAEYITRAGGDTPLHALTALLRTPRALKHFVRRVDHTWRSLHGEVELDDVIIVTALRHGEESAYRFLVSAMDAARMDRSEMLPRTMSVKEEWEETKKGFANPGAVERLVDILGIKQLTRHSVNANERSPQGIHSNEPIDYFRRILAEGLDSAELRDQTVLRDILEWRRTRGGNLVPNLLGESGEAAHYAGVWKHFSAFHLSAGHPDTELMELTSAVVTGVLERDGAAAAVGHPAIIALWRTCALRPQNGQFDEWLHALILGTISRSLNLTNGLYQYWTGRDGVVPKVQRHKIRRSVVSAVRERVRSGRDLAMVLSKEHPHTVVNLVTESGDDAGLSADAAWRDYLPSLLIEGAEHDSETVVPQLARLAGGTGSYTLTGVVGSTRSVRRYEIDRERMASLFGEDLDAVLRLMAEYNGDDEYAVRAKDDATSWMEERKARHSLE